LIRDVDQSLQISMTKQTILSRWWICAFQCQQLCTILYIAW